MADNFLFCITAIITAKIADITAKIADIRSLYRGKKASKEFFIFR